MNLALHDLAPAATIRVLRRAAPGAGQRSAVSYGSGASLPGGATAVGCCHAARASSGCQ
eukprot:CAMPEP_0197931804 /NCGR_PEP_ID=MMETSP1439-20131203/107657_1 /TAXON_ID=66791 /ORGANISM="Gonyaulax spinifera, Strain CCMP409" /LENGTH=58 /DNA_ID=CAMNT_0043554557 /DNA_START=120 /DNA_END=293 /DNA_ORIENTATION=+